MLMTYESQWPDKLVMQGPSRESALQGCALLQRSKQEYFIAQRRRSWISIAVAKSAIDSRAAAVREDIDKLADLRRLEPESTRCKAGYAEVLHSSIGEATLCPVQIGLFHSAPVILCGLLRRRSRPSVAPRSTVLQFVSRELRRRHFL